MKLSEHNQHYVILHFLAQMVFLNSKNDCMTIIATYPHIFTTNNKYKDDNKLQPYLDFTHIYIHKHTDTCIIK